MACIACRHELSLLAEFRLDGAADPFPEPGIEPNYAPSRSIRIQHMHVSLSIEPADATFKGTARIAVMPLPISTGSATFDFDEVVVDSVTDADGNALDWTHGDGRLKVRGVTEPTTLVVQWTGDSPRRGMYFTGPTQFEPNRQHMAWTQCQDEDGHFVFPCHDHPGIKHTWSIELDAPEGYTLLSNGSLSDSGVRNGRSWARYEQREAMPAYLFTAVAARLSVIEGTGGPVPIRYLVPVGQEEHAVRAMGKTPLMIEEFARKTGIHYPWPRYDQVVVHDFIFGGMENVACTTMTDLLLVDTKAVLEWDPDGLVAHELAHQWFGDLVTCQDWSQAWLNESWATFMESVWWQADRPEEDATWYRWELGQSYLGEDSGRYRRPIVSYQFREPIDVFDRHLYEKGATVLSTLRFELGEGPFWAGVNHYLTRHAHSTVHSRHFQRALEDATGANLDRFFDQWIFGAGHPALEVNLSEEPGLVVATVKQTQTGNETADVFHFTLRLVLVSEDGSERIVDLPVQERERSWAIPVDGDIATVRVDPAFRVLGTIKLSGPGPWLEQLLGDACPVVAVRAARGLLEKGSASGFDAVVHALREHPWHGVRSTIARALGSRGGDDSRDALLAALSAEPDPRTVRGIVEGLGQFREEVVATRLLEQLNGDEPATWQLWGSLLTSLGKTRDPRAVEALSANLDVQGWGSLVQQRALTGLAATEDPAALPILLERSKTSHPPRLRAAAAAALSVLGDKVESTRTAVVERLCEMVREPGFRPRLASVAALGRVRDSRASAVLTQVHRSDPDGRIRRGAFESLRKIRKGRTTEAGLATMRGRLESLAEENHKLRSRIDKLERM